MDAIREQLNKPVVAGVVGIILGIVLGLFYGYIIDPVEWTDLPITSLRSDLKNDYMRMAIIAYNQTGDVETAQRRFAEFGEEGPEVLQQVTTDGSFQDPQLISQYQIAVMGSAAAEEAEGVQEAEPAAASGGGFLSTFLFVLCGLILVGGLGVGIYYYYTTRMQNKEPAIESPVLQAQEAARQAEYTDYSAIGSEQPMAQFMASYRIGDDLFDDSFSIDSPSGEFLGECGVGISETIGVGDPKKVSAFEVWLFDKDDIQTVTKVFMSAHAFLDEATRSRLSNKGEPILTEAGTEIVLETKTLKMVTRVIDMGYGDAALPEHSFFDRLVLELAVWAKS